MAETQRKIEKAVAEIQRYKGMNPGFSVRRGSDKKQGKSLKGGCRAKIIIFLCFIKFSVMVYIWTVHDITTSM